MCLKQLFRVPVCMAAGLACIFLTACLTDPDIKLAYDGYTPAVRNDGWDISTPQAEGLRTADIDRIYRKVYSEDLFPAIHSMLIVRNGNLVAEAYCRDKGEIDRYHHIQSATKSITSLLTGIAIDQGLITSTDQTIYQFIPEYFDADLRKREITIHHTLTMETGLDFDNDEHTVELYYGTGSSLKYVLEKKLIFTPGSDWYYGDGNPQLLSGVIQRVSGMDEASFAVKYLFGPLGITHFKWERHADGLNFGAVCLWLLPRDMAKIGKLMVQDGLWDGERLISSEWIARSTRLQSTHQNYGYYWYPMDEDGAFYAQGHGGQMIYVVQRLDLVVVVTADPYSDSRALSSNFDDLFREVVKAVLQ